jgi:hypothetical protein
MISGMPFAGSSPAGSCLPHSPTYLNQQNKELCAKSPPQEEILNPDASSFPKSIVSSGMEMGGRLERCKHCTPVYALFAAFRDKNQFCDIQLKLPPVPTWIHLLNNRNSMVGQEIDLISAHKVIIASASSAFATYLDENPSTCVIDLSLWIPIDYFSIFHIVFDFIYSRQAAVTAHNILGVQGAARTLGISDLLHLSNSILTRFIQADPTALIPRALEAKRFDVLDIACQTLLQSRSLSSRLKRPKAREALCTLPIQNFLKFISKDEIKSALTPTDIFDLIQEFVQFNSDPNFVSRRRCLEHGCTFSSPRAPPNPSVAKDIIINSICICDTFALLSQAEIRMCFSQVEMTSLDPDLLGRAFAMPHVPQDIVFQAVMSKLVSLQASTVQNVVPSPPNYSLRTTSRISLNQSGTLNPLDAAPDKGFPHTETQSYVQSNALTPKEMKEIVTSSLSRMKTMSSRSHKETYQDTDSYNKGDAIRTNCEQVKASIGASQLSREISQISLGERDT